MSGCKVVTLSLAFDCARPIGPKRAQPALLKNEDFDNIREQDFNLATRPLTHQSFSNEVVAVQPTNNARAAAISHSDSPPLKPLDKLTSASAATHQRPTPNRCRPAASPGYRFTVRLGVEPATEHSSAKGRACRLGRRLQPVCSTILPFSLADCRMACAACNLP